MSELRVGAVVRGTAGDLGKVEALVIDPTNASVTHLVVGHEPLGRRVLVPITKMHDATPQLVQVDLTEETLHECESFDEPSYNIPGEDVPFEPGSYFLEPFATPLDGFLLAEHERIPKGEITLRRGDEVRSSDGTHVGHVDELLVDPADGHVTHAVLRQGHMLRRSDDFVVPIGGAHFAEGRVVLGLDLVGVEQLEHIPVKRHGHVLGRDVQVDQDRPGDDLGGAATGTD